MIQRFNFYDIYGYLIPGLTLVVLLWLPSALVTHHWEDARVGSVVVALVAAYIIGHLVQNLSANAISLAVSRTADGKAAYPSPTILDPNDRALQDDIKRRVGVNAFSWFGIDVAVGKLADRDVAARRNAAFSLCRPTVNSRTAYAEQYQGLYTMSRGLVVAFALCACYMTGWILACYHITRGEQCAYFVGSLGILAVVALSIIRTRARINDDAASRHGMDVAILACMGVAILSAGVVTASRESLDGAVLALSFASAALYVIAAFRFFLLYRYFAVEFAKAVWTTFAAEPNERVKADVIRLEHAIDHNDDGDAG